MAIAFREMSHIYSADMPFAVSALRNIDLNLEEEKITAIIGETGSGKSTLIQHLNALLLPTSGEVEVGEFLLTGKMKQKKLKPLRKKVGLVFQFSEYQLFEETVLKDVAFGPKNFGVNEEESLRLAKESLQKVGISSELWERSPLELSGGQKRRVAIAGILAMNPDIIVLDEPTAGLDPRGARDMISLFKRLNQEEKKTIFLVCHDNELVYRYCENVVVMKEGEVVYHGKSKEFFENKKERESLSLLAPHFIRFREKMQEKGFSVEKASSLEELITLISREIIHE